ncbi:MAG: phenylacetate--CoA ligase [bacterium]|nr:phenylacetate--CoA ligase [bacterium]
MKSDRTLPTESHPASVPDYLPGPRLRELQLGRLRAVASQVYEKVEFCRRRMEAGGVTPGDIRDLEDIARLPFTVKDDLRDTYPFGLFAVPMSDVVRLHASSGTTGKPIVAPYTRQDLEVWTNAMVRCLTACGIHREDVIQNAFGYGLFTGGLGFHNGAEALGATVVPISGGNTDRQITLMKDFGVTLICCTPSYFIYLLERAGELGVDLRDLPLRAGVFGAEPWSESMRRHIETGGGIQAFDLYGLSEIIGPGVAVECSHRNGLHVLEDHFYPEIIHPETGQPLPEGDEGELVLTTLSKAAMPLLRYRTRDVTSFIPGPCPCGRTLRRIRRIGRRSDDMLIIRGVNVYPSQVETALLEVEGTLPHYQIILTRDKGLDQMEVRVEVTPAALTGKELTAKLVRAIEKAIGLRVLVSPIEAHSIQRSEGKATRVVDQRQR